MSEIENNVYEQDNLNFQNNSNQIEFKNENKDIRIENQIVDKNKNISSENININLENKFSSDIKNNLDNNPIPEIIQSELNNNTNFDPKLFEQFLLFQKFINMNNTINDSYNNTTNHYNIEKTNIQNNYNKNTSHGNFNKKDYLNLNINNYQENSIINESHLKKHNLKSISDNNIQSNINDEINKINKVENLESLDQLENFFPAKNKTQAIKTKEIKNSISANKNKITNSLQKLNSYQDSIENKMNYYGSDSIVNKIISSPNNLLNQNTSTKPSLNFDDVPIKSKGVNFIELLEQNLAKNNIEDADNNLNHNFNNHKENKITRKPRFKKVINVSKPTETKKYKYYTDNFNSNENKEIIDIKEDSNDIETKINKVTSNTTNKYKHINRIKEKGKIPLNKNKSETKIINKNKNDSLVIENENVSFKIDKNKKINIKTQNFNKSKEKFNNFNNNQDITLNLNNNISAIDYLAINTDQTLESNLNINKDHSFLNKNKNTQITNKSKIPEILKKEKSLPNILVKNESNLSNINTQAKGENALKKLRNLQKNNKWGEAKFEDIEIKDNLNNNLNNNYVDNAKISKNKIDNNSAKKEENIIYTNNINKKAFIEFKNENDSNNNENKFSVGFNFGFTNNLEVKKAPLTYYNDSIKLNKNDNYVENVNDENNSEENSIENINYENDYECEISTVIYNHIDAEFLENINDNDINKNLHIKENNNDNNLETVLTNTFNIPTNNLEDKILLISKIKEFNNEIQKFKYENEKVSALRIEYEKLTKKLNSDIKEQSEKRDKEIKEFELYKEEEIKRLQKEKKVYERNMKYTQNIPNKKDKEEIEILKSQISKISDEFKTKENTNRIVIDKLKKQLEEANGKILEINKNNENIIIDKTTYVNVNNISSKKNSNQVTSLQNSKSSKKLLDGNINNLNNLNVQNNPLVTNNKEKCKKYNTIINDKINNDFNNKEEQEIKKILPTFNPSFSESYDLLFIDKYHPKINPPKLIKIEQALDGKIVKNYENDKKEIIFPSGVIKEIHSDGYHIVYFSNKDIKQVYPSGKSVYYFNEAKTIQTTFPDNMQIFKFENGQIEKHFPEGKKEIYFPDGTVSEILADQEIYKN